MRHHQRPGGERHELPREQEGIGVGGDEDEVHAREEGGEERQHALRIVLVPAVAERVQARRRRGEVHDDEKERRQRIDMETRADPGQAERQNERLAGAAEGERADRDEKQKRRQDERPAVHDRPPHRSCGDERACDRKSEERGVADETERLGAHLLSPSSRRDRSPAHRPHQNLRESSGILRKTVAEIRTALSRVLQKREQLAMHDLVAAGRSTRSVKKSGSPSASVT